MFRVILRLLSATVYPLYTYGKYTSSIFVLPSQQALPSLQGVPNSSEVEDERVKETVRILAREALDSGSCERLERRSSGNDIDLDSLAFRSSAGRFADSSDYRAV